MRFLLLVLSLCLSTSAIANWQVDNDKSTLNFTSVKKNSIGEIHSFKQLSGMVSKAGAVKFAIDLTSVATGIEIRDQRMKSFLFETDKFATATFAGQILLVIVYRENQPVAAAMYLFNATGLYGRYWGAMEEVDGLHFECCYYSGIEFAIQHRLPLFNPGTQGEHKILRGFEPELCFSAHHCLDQRFHAAVEDFVLQEQRAIAHYYEQTRAVVPFKQNPD